MEQKKREEKEETLKPISVTVVRERERGFEESTFHALRNKLNRGSSNGTSLSYLK